MRLTSYEVAAIKAAATANFGRDAIVRLFGSRVHDHLRGGDIDLHIEVSNGDAARHARSRFVRELYRSIGERSIDVLIQERATTPNKFDDEARRTGIVL